jgi:hypothetical protein
MAVAVITRDRYEALAGRAKLLSWLSLAWMTIEGAVAIAAGIAAGSIALVGFGLDSAIEGFASVIIIWRFTGERGFSHAAEERAQRLVAVQFFLLAPYVGFESVRALAGGEHAETTWVGIAWPSARSSSCRRWPSPSSASPTSSARPPPRVRGARTCSAPTSRARCLLGLLGNALLGAWWLDPLVGLLIAAVAVKEGREAGAARAVA